MIRGALWQPDIIQMRTVLFHFQDELIYEIGIPSCIFMDFLSFFLPNCNIKLMTCRDNSLTADYQWISWSKNPWELCQNHMIFPPFVTWPKHIVLFWLSSRIILWHGGWGIAFILSGFKNVSLTIHWWPKSWKKMQLYLCVYKAKRLNF